MAKNKHDRHHPLALLVPFLRRHWLRLAAGLGALLLVDFCQLTIPRVIKKAIDKLELGSASRPELLQYALLIILLALGIALMRFFWRYFILGFSRIVEQNLRARLFSRLLDLDLLFFQQRTTGELMALATNDLSAVQLAIGMGLVAFIDAAVMSVAAIIFMAWIHPLLTLLAVAPLPLLAVLTRMLSIRLHQKFALVQEGFSTLTEFARNALSSISFIKAYGHETRQTAEFDRLGQAYVADNLKLARVQGAMLPASGLVANASLLLVLFFGGRLAIRGTISIGDFVAFIAYLYLLTWPMMAFGWVANLFQRGVTSLRRIQEILLTVPTVRDCPGCRQNSDFNGEIEIRNLTFSFAGLPHPALAGVSVHIRPGLLGVAGRTGSGKTTFCHLIARLYPAPPGTIFFGGADANALALQEVYGSIAYVPQEVTLFSDTIENNIVMGRLDMAPGQMEAAARIAAIHEEIMAMAAGYQTLVGERGISLSGGQRQRIGLARALLLQRPVLIIDDGLSAVDVETEHEIIRALAGYLGGKTCILVSNRVSPLIEAHEIIIFEQGRIVDRGSHEHLLRHNDYYQEIYQRQMAK